MNLNNTFYERDLLIKRSPNFEEDHQYIVMGDKTYTSVTELCERFDYKIQECSYPYLETPYANCVKDNESLIQLIKGEKKKSFPFWGNIMQIVLEK